MNPSVSEVTTVEIEARREGSTDLALLRATGSVLKDPGFLRVYGQVAETEAQNAPEDEAEGDDAKVRLPRARRGRRARAARGAASRATRRSRRRASTRPRS